MCDILTFELWVVRAAEPRWRLRVLLGAHFTFLCVAVKQHKTNVLVSVHSHAGRLVEFTERRL